MNSAYSSLDDQDDQEHWYRDLDDVDVFQQKDAFPINFWAEHCAEMRRRLFERLKP